jgi:hypothetical protein
VPTLRRVPFWNVAQNLEMLVSYGRVMRGDVPLTLDCGIIISMGLTTKVVNFVVQNLNALTDIECSAVLNAYSFVEC